MNVEERRSVQKLAKINEKMKNYMQQQKEKELKEKQKKEDFIIISQNNCEFLNRTIIYKKAGVVGNWQYF